MQQFCNLKLTAKWKHRSIYFWLALTLTSCLPLSLADQLRFAALDPEIAYFSHLNGKTAVFYHTKQARYQQAVDSAASLIESDGLRPNTLVMTGDSFGVIWLRTRESLPRGRHAFAITMPQHGHRNIIINITHAVSDLSAGDLFRFPLKLMDQDRRRGRLGWLISGSTPKTYTSFDDAGLFYVWRAKGEQNGLDIKHIRKLEGVIILFPEAARKLLR